MAKSSRIVVALLGIAAIVIALWYFLWRKKDSGKTPDPGPSPPKPNPPKPNPNPPSGCKKTWTAAMMKRPAPTDSDSYWARVLWQEATGSSSLPPAGGGTNIIANYLTSQGGNTIEQPAADQVCKGTCYWNHDATVSTGYCDCVKQTACLPSPSSS